MEYFAFFHIYLISNNKSLSEYWNEYRNGQRCLILFINPFKPAFTIVTTSRELLPQSSTCSG